MEFTESFIKKEVKNIRKDIEASNLEEGKKEVLLSLSDNELTELIIKCENELYLELYSKIVSKKDGTPIVTFSDFV